ncbi:MAG TPA: glutamate formimidoyltransferase [Bacteroidia bacterium]|nr:glutamate formimidoyltransferase [Bacteroidia bacterium]
MEKLIECVPNFSEGHDTALIKTITDEIEKIDGIKLLDVDPGKATNRTVVTFVGSPDAVVEAAFHSIKRASELIDMSKHKGEHPRMGATDVCPLIPLSGITVEETVKYANLLAARVGKELGIPVYLYEYAQPNKNRSNLSVIREGEYEGFSKKIKKPEWKPDFGPTELPVRSGATVIGVRDFLVAYNVNLNTTSVRRANSIAFDIRERGRVVKDEKGNDVHLPGTLKSVKAIGWYIEEYGQAQVSINLTNINIAPVHIAFEEVCKSAQNRGMRVTGSELVGLIPLQSMLDAGKYFLKKQNRSTGVSESELIHIAIKSLGLDDLTEFHPDKKIIEYRMKKESDSALQNLTVKAFADLTASESPAPGGGSISAYLGSLGAALGTMVANLSSVKKGWEPRIQEFSDWAEKGQSIKDKLLKAVDEDTAAFNGIMSAFGLPKNTDTEKQARKEAVKNATISAIEVPYKVMQLSLESMQLIKAMAETGNPNSVSDAGVAALCARSAVIGAHLNVKINASGLADKSPIAQLLQDAAKLETEAIRLESEVLGIVNKVIGNS